MKVDYGVRALVALAQQYGEGPVQTAEIASRQNIPEPYLDQLLTTLSKFGFIRSRRGPQGGHVLARPPSGITLEMVMSTLEGTSAPLDCFEEPAECIYSRACAQREVWRSVEEAVQTVLSSTTIADLANRQRRLTTRGMYQI
ncbi:MAG: Rrf2 family transcriptional regulator [Chloroflexi bacterium]|nr:Rrf2 family transcriptional regulator [Chloroflexota bacterium]